MKPRVHHVSSCDFTGGAARAGYRLHRGLLAAGVDSLWLDAHPKTCGQPDIRRIHRPWSARSPLKQLASSYREDQEIRNAFKGTHTFASRPNGWGLPKALLAAGKPDLFHFHWVSNFLDWEKTLHELAGTAPIAWSLHDLNPTMGAWHYLPDSHECNPRRDRIERELIEKKRRALARIPRERLVFICPSRWMAERCRASEITSRFESVVIPYGIDPHRFFPVPKDKARAALGISGDQPVLGFLAYDLNDPRKGMDLLCGALTAMRAEQPPLLLTIGRAAEIPLEGIRHQALGTVTDDETLRVFYSACDLFVCPSRQDNLPNTVLESLACGTPVAGFHIGGLPDMVMEGVTGILAADTTSESLRDVVSNLLSDRQKLAAMALHARDYFLANFSEEIQTKAVLSLYHRMLHPQAIP
jgi:glycosyltransferase involved in cell wall biosynthesis